MVGMCGISIEEVTRILSNDDINKNQKKLIELAADIARKAVNLYGADDMKFQLDFCTVVVASETKPICSAAAFYIYEEINRVKKISSIEEKDVHILISVLYAAMSGAADAMHELVEYAEQAIFSALYAAKSCSKTTNAITSSLQNFDRNIESFSFGK